MPAPNKAPMVPQGVRNNFSHTSRESQNKLCISPPLSALLPIQWKPSEKINTIEKLSAPARAHRTTLTVHDHIETLVG